MESTLNAYDRHFIVEFQFLNLDMIIADSNIRGLKLLTDF